MYISLLLNSWAFFLNTFFDVSFSKKNIDSKSQLEKS